MAVMKIEWLIKSLCECCTDMLNVVFRLHAIKHQSKLEVALKWHTEFGHLNRGDMLTSEQHRCSNEKKKF